MDEIALLRGLPSEAESPEAAARAAALRALEARFDSALSTPGPIATPVRRPSFPRRRLLAFAGSAAAAAAVAGILVLSSGPTAQPAAAEILHTTAAVAAAGDATDVMPGPGQFLYKKTKQVELRSWVPGGESMGGGVMTRPGAFAALMPTTQEEWLGPDGAGRTREVAGTPDFLTSAEQGRWEAAGSRLPAPFDPEYQRKYLESPPKHPPYFHEALEARPGVVDRETTYTGGARLKGFRFPDTSSLPTEPEALRRAVESNQISVTGFNLMYPSARRLDREQTIAELFNILSEGYVSTPQLRAAIFNALAELPGVKVDTGATDSLGRHGYAIRSIEPKTGGGFEYIFDPDTSEVLAERDFIGDPAGNPFLKGVPAGTTVRETAYLETGVVDSTHETAAEAEAAPS
jgi:hypothetical protein